MYEIIVESVVNEVREDFENAGIDEQTLQDLKNIWQKKLTETKVTTFSWDNQFNEGNINGVQNDLNFNLATPSVNSSEFNIKEENTGNEGLILPNINSNNNIPHSGETNINTNTVEATNNSGATLNTNTSGNTNADVTSQPKIEVKPEIELTINNANITTVENIDDESEKKDDEEKEEDSGKNPQGKGADRTSKITSEEGKKKCIIRYG